MVATVLVTCIVAAGALTLTYEVTRERIIEQERAAERAALQAVAPEATEFEQADELLEPAITAVDKVPVQAVFRAFGADGTQIGWNVRVAPRGYAGPVTMVVGLDRFGTVLGVSIITMNETPGLGTKIVALPGWIDQFAGWESTTLDSSLKSFDAIAGATRSSSAVRNGVAAACQVYNEVLATQEGEASGS
jgi:electron transport complex protein RnfG